MPYIPCNHSFTQTAYVLDSLTDIITEDTHKIKIHDYEYDSDLQKAVCSGTKIICCSNKHKLIKCWSTKVSPYFRHQQSVFKHENEKHISFESKWHREWKEQFIQFDEKCNEVDVQKINGSIRERRIDVKLGNLALEFEHSKKEGGDKEVDAKLNDYNLHNLITLWIIDCNNNTIDVFDCKNGYYLITFNSSDDPFRDDTWKYNNYRNQGAIYLDADNMIYMINPSSVNGDMVYTTNAMTKHKFIDHIGRTHTLPWDITTKLDIQCRMYISQQPAGSGKTYNSIQKLNGMPLFKEKQYFIYVTKLHSAKSVTKKEFDDQYKDGRLTSITEVDDNNLNGAKQIVVQYTNTQTQKKCVIIFQTIDSFMYQLRNKSVNSRSNDYFESVVSNVHSDKSKAIRTLKYKALGNSISIPLDKRTIVIVDECQDLGGHYVNALMRIMGTTHIDVYVIGDRLQSIWGNVNAFTLLDNFKQNSNKQIKIIEEKPTTCVRRFHNIQLMEFVNKLVMFDKYGLPKIESICPCNKDECKFIDWHNNNTKQMIDVFLIPRIYGNICTEATEATDITINKIIDKMGHEIAENNYLPEHFTFIFPHLRNNALANTLETKLQEFWVNKFNNKEYASSVVTKNKYWDEHNKNTLYNRFVVLHKADEGQSINLDESEHATRIMSIHASKGTGREVIFVVGISERSLHFYANETDSLQYESLLHVAVTRQKKSLYIAIYPDAKCDIYRRLSKIAKIEVDNEIKPDLNGIGNTLKLQRIIDCNFSDRSAYDNLEKTFCITENTNKHITQQYAQAQQDETLIVDWGHHVIRNAVFKLRLLMNIYNNEKYDDKHDQFKEIMRKLGDREISSMTYSGYYQAVDTICGSYYKQNALKTEISSVLYKIQLENDKWKLKELHEKRESLESDLNKLKCVEKLFPLLVFEAFKESRYYEYCDTIKQIMESVKNKIRLAILKHKMPDIMCPLEMVILYHMMLLPDRGRSSEVTIMDIYNIVYCYDDSFYKIKEEEKQKHLQYKCLCGKLFKKNRASETHSTAMADSIVKHYAILKCVDNLYEKYINLSLVKDNEWKYNVNKYMELKFKEQQLPKCIHQQFIVASNANDVILIDCVPQFNRLNANEIYTRMLYVNYVCTTMEKYVNLHVHWILFTLNYEYPLCFDIHNDVVANNTFLQKSCMNAVKNNIMQYASIAWMYYDFYRNRKDNKTNSIEYTLNQCAIAKKTKFGTEHIPRNKNFPVWFIGFVCYLKKKLDKSSDINKQKKYRAIIESEENFTNGLNDFIDSLIKKELQRPTNNDY